MTSLQAGTARLSPSPMAEYARAVIDLPPVVGVHTQGQQMLCRVSDDWFVLVGRDDTSDTSWVMPLIHELAGYGDWTVVWETYGEILVTHFTRD